MRVLHWCDYRMCDAHAGYKRLEYSFASRVATINRGPIRLSEAVALMTGATSFKTDV